jgi:hypothetical protein
MDDKAEKSDVIQTTPNSKVDDFEIGEISSLDEADIFLREHNFTHEYIQELLVDKELNKKLVRKIDLILLPMLAGTYVLQYVDKSALAYSAVFDLFTDTGISNDQYSWLASIFSLLTWLQSTLGRTWRRGREWLKLCLAVSSLGELSS